MEINTVSSKAPLVLTGSYTGTDAEWCANITEEAVLTRKRLELDRSLRQLQIRKPLKRDKLAKRRPAWQWCGFLR